MNWDAARSVSFPSWSAWTAKFALRRILFREQIADLSGKRARAEKRAVAAEVIAQEANAARLQVLLDAAREQATVQTIASAERRFEEAKGAWQAAQAPLFADADLIGENGADIAPPAVGQDSASVSWFSAFLWRLGKAGSSPQIALRSTAAASLILGGVYVYLDPDIGGGELLATATAPVTETDARPAETFTNIDPLVLMSWPVGPSADGGSASHPMGRSETQRDDAAPALRQVSAPQPVDKSAMRSAPGRRSIRMRLVPVPAPTPARNPFYYVPQPPAAPVPSISPIGIE